MNNELKSTLKVSLKTRDLIICSLLTALVFIATRFMNIRLPVSVNGGLIHLGNTVLFMSAIVFGKNKGAIAGAFGMGLFDILSGWIVWAPFTFIIRGAMGYITGRIAYLNNKNGNSLVYNSIGILAASIFMIAGYYITEVILYGNLTAPITSIPGNIIQLVVGAAVAIPLSAALKRTKLF
ncbi:MAG: ECF transporter S component [Clostridia bacterium]